MPTVLVNENLPLQLVQRAREHGHEARWVRNIMPGASDRRILTEILSSKEHLVTRDVRFANTVFARIGMEEELSGIVLIREQRMKHIRTAWDRYIKRDEYPVRALIVLEVHRTRIRRFSKEDSS